jgi:hypothetical protein
LWFLFLGAGQVHVSKFTANVSIQNSREIQVKWTVDTEQEVTQYRLERKMVQDNDFKPISNIAVSTIPPTKIYQFTDKNVFKTTSGTEPVVYALYVDFQNGDTKYIGQAEVNYTTTAIRRTWGSIKAMFQ